MPIAVNVNTSYSSCMMYMTTGRGGGDRVMCQRKLNNVLSRTFFFFLFFKLGPGIKKIGEAQLQKGLFFPVFLINNKIYPKI